MTFPEERVARAARKASASRHGLEAAIREAHAAGLSLRRIATLVGMSHETVRRIVSA